MELHRYVAHRYMELHRPSYVLPSMSISYEADDRANLEALYELHMEAAAAAAAAAADADAGATGAGAGGHVDASASSGADAGAEADCDSSGASSGSLPSGALAPRSTSLGY